MFRSLLGLSLLLTLLTVVLSAYIRLAEIGVGCDSWPDCYAILNPEQEKRGITVLTQAGEDMAYRGARLAHRYIASTLGLAIVLVFIGSWRQRRTGAVSMRVPGLLLLVTVFLSLLGYYTPTRSNPLITMGNLLGGISMAGLLWWMMRRHADSAIAEANQQLATLARVALVLICIQICLGGWSSANYASAACAGLFSCEQSWLQPGLIADAYNPMREIKLTEQGHVVQEQAQGVMTMLHRGFALITALYLAWLVRKVKPHPAYAGSAIAMSFFSISLIIAGVSMIWLQLPLLLVSLHNGLAVGLLLASINLLHGLTPRPEGFQPPD